MRQFLLWALILICGPQSRSLQAADWSVDIVPELSKDKGQYIHLGHPFYVVSTNVTNNDLTAWREWCSCGYFNLRFDFTIGDGKTYQVVKKPRSWLQNYPDAFLVHPGKHFVLAVSLIDREWDGLENLNGPIRIQATYQNTNSFKPIGEWKGPPAWLGEVKSEPMEVTIDK